MTPWQFCWTKFGWEAGEDPSEILRRKEKERLDNNGLFLWGIGNSVGPSILTLIEATSEPVVVFTPMRSPAAVRDQYPLGIGLWTSAIGLDGKPFEMPRGSYVTSGLRSDTTPSHHYALVCQHDSPLDLDLPAQNWLDDQQLRNLRSGSRVGSSQVTSVVRRTTELETQRRYRVTLMARLVAPYQVTLGDCLRQA